MPFNATSGFLGVRRGRPTGVELTHVPYQGKPSGRATLA